MPDELRHPKLSAAFKWAVVLQPVSTAIYFTMPFTIMVYMVADFGLAAGDEEAVGRLTGYMGSMSHVGSLLAAVPWGMVSDQLGRKPVIIFGHVFSGLTVVYFGLSPNYTAALLSRFAGGLGNGVLGALKTLIGETSSREDAPRTMSFLSTGWGIGCVVGPILGGMLSRPCDSGMLGSSTAFCRDGEGVFARHPYLLPCLVCLMVNLVSAFAALLLFSETLSAPTKRIACWPAWLRKTSYQKLDMAARSDQLNAGEEDDGPCEHCETTATDITVKKWWRTPECLTHLVMYGILAFFSTFLDEVLPIYAAATRDAGGLHLKSSQLGVSLSFAGGCLLIFTLIFYPMLVQQLGGLKHTLLAGSILSTVPTLTIPLITYVPADRLTVQLVLLSIVLGAKSVCQSSAFTSSLILLNQSAPPGTMAAVNGVGQTISSLVRALGPTMGGVLWALSLSSRIPGHQTIVFAFVAAWCISGACFYRSRWRRWEEFLMDPNGSATNPSVSELATIRADHKPEQMEWTEVYTIDEE